jgi:DNA-binding transcriptional MerR regulator
MKKKMDHPIRTVADRTGLSQHSLRIWEKRYKAVVPVRTATKRRYYSEEDIERLKLLKALTDKGHRIGRVAQLPIDELRELNDLVKRDTHFPQYAHNPTPHELLKGALGAICELNLHALDLCLAQASVLISPFSIVDQLIVPLLHELGKRWRGGELRIVHCQFAFSSLHPFLVNTIKAHPVLPTAPLLVTALLSGQVHEFGLLLAMAVAAAMGWRTLYLGANLPPAEIAAGLHFLNGKVLALSLVYPPGDPLIHKELKQLKKLIPQGVKILVGGSDADSYAATLREIGAIPVTGLSELQRLLETFHRMPL